MAPPKPKRSRKKKAVATVLFDKNVNVIECNENLNSLYLEKSSLEKDIKSIIDTYNSKTSSAESAEEFFDSLPLDTIQDYQAYAAGHKKDFNLTILRTRHQLKIDEHKKSEELRQIDKKISEKQIDLLLAKINCVIDSLDKKETNEI